MTQFDKELYDEFDAINKALGIMGLLFQQIHAEFYALPWWATIRQGKILKAMNLNTRISTLLLRRLEETYKVICGM